jgi:hypothetical protein
MKPDQPSPSAVPAGWAVKPNAISGNAKPIYLEAPELKKMANANAHGGPVQSTDRELWRERPDDYYADSLHVTADGGIGMKCGGSVIVMPIRRWHALAKQPSPSAVPIAPQEAERLIAAAKQADWMQVVLNYGPPCFHLEESGRFCLRAERWAGHVKGGTYPEHTFIPLDALLAARLPAEARPSPTEPTKLSIVVNGQPVIVHAGPIRDVIAAAIQKSGQIGAPVDQWVLRTRDGEVIPHALPGGVEWALSGGQQLFLHLGLPRELASPSPIDPPSQEGATKTNEPIRLESSLAAVLNRFSVENASNTPDFILAQYLLGCLAAWNQAVQQRETWYGRDPRPTAGSGPVPVHPSTVKETPCSTSHP